MTWRRWALAKDASGNDDARPQQPWTNGGERPRQLPFAGDEVHVRAMGLTIEIGVEHRVTSS